MTKLLFAVFLCTLLVVFYSMLGFVQPLDIYHLRDICQKCFVVLILVTIFVVYQEALSQSENVEDFGRDDIFAKVFNVKEHPGRVRCAGFPVSQKTFFESQKDPPHESEEVKRLRAEVNDLRLLVQQMHATMHGPPHGQTQGQTEGQTQEKTHMNANIQPSVLPTDSGSSTQVHLPEVNMVSCLR